jgi:hypothetical protein
MELAALGHAVWLVPIATGVLAVCYETMQRAKTNIEILVGALEAEGYDFHHAVSSALVRTYPPLLCRTDPDILIGACHLSLGNRQQV